MLALMLALCQPADPAVDALKPLAALKGRYTTVKTEFDPRTGQGGAPVKGTENVFPRAVGRIIVCDREDETGYGDVLIYQYDADSKKVKAYLFMPLAESKLRPITVAFEGSAVVLEYEPLVQGDRVTRTRETITARPGGGYTRLVERKLGDGSYLKRREIIGTPVKGGN